MTSINAIRFDQYSGAMVCDEQRHWNSERIKIYAADKVRPIVPAEIRARYGIAAAYGNTGTSAIGDELRLTMYREVDSLFNRKCLEEGKEPDEFLTIHEVARLGWDVIRKMKHKHVDEYLQTKYGLTRKDILRGFKIRNGNEIPIKNPDVIQDAMDNIARSPNLPGSDAVFGNGGILAGFDQTNGFQIYAYSMKEGTMEPAESGYAALGSGGDTTNFIIPQFLNRIGVEGRENGFEPVFGVWALLDAVNMAAEHNLGVGGYYNIVLFDQRGDPDTGMFREINDHRSKLVCEAIRAHRNKFINTASCKGILEGILFQNKTAEWGEDVLWTQTPDVHGMHRLFRGYPVLGTVNQ